MLRNIRWLWLVYSQNGNVSKINRCGHCRNFHPEFESAAKLVKSRFTDAVLVEIDGPSNNDFTTEYDVSGFPTVFVFFNSMKSYQQYQGNRKAEDIVQYVS